MGYYEFLDHTADILIKAYGNDLKDAFSEAAKAYFDMIIETKADRKDAVKSVNIEGDDLENLLVRFLSEMIILFEIDSFIGLKFDIELNDKSIRGKIYGEKYDPSKHGYGHHVKGVSYHMIEVYEGEPCHVQVLFDI